MKAALLFLTMGCAALVCGPRCAAASDYTTPQQNTKAVVPQSAGGRSSDRKDLRRSTTEHKQGVPKQPLRPRPGHSEIKNARNTRKPGSASHAPENPQGRENFGASKSKSVQAIASRRSFPVAPPVRHHSPNPATLGGSSSSSGSHVGVINGTHVSRRP